MSNSLANYLRKVGIQRNEIIPTICDKTYHFFVGFFGILKAGGFFYLLIQNCQKIEFNICWMK